MSEAIGEARVTRAQNRKRACCSQPESSTRTKRKQRAGKKKAADTVANTSASTNTDDTANTNASASTNTATNTADTSVSTSTATPTSKTSGEKDAKIRQRKATLLGHFGVSSPLISFLFHSVSILTTVQEVSSSTLLTTINTPCHLYHVRIETGRNWYFTEYTSCNVFVRCV